MTEAPVRTEVTEIPFDELPEVRLFEELGWNVREGDRSMLEPAHKVSRVDCMDGRPVVDVNPEEIVGETDDENGMTENTKPEAEMQFPGGVVGIMLLKTNGTIAGARKACELLVEAGYIPGWHGGHTPDDCGVWKLWNEGKLGVSKPTLTWEELIGVVREYQGDYVTLGSKHVETKLKLCLVPNYFIKKDPAHFGLNMEVADKLDIPHEDVIKLTASAIEKLGGNKEVVIIR